MNHYELRDYQRSLIECIFASWTRGNRKVMAQLPTAGGKTVVLASVALEFLKQGEGALVVAHRRELILQARDKLEAITGLQCGVIKAGFPVHPDRDIQVASIQSLTRRQSYPSVGLVIVDEAHHCVAKSYSDLLEKYSNAYVLGLTATPCRSDGHGFQYYFDDLVVGSDTAKLIESGYLSKYKLFASKPISTKGIKKVAGEFNQSQLEEVAMRVIGDVAPTWQKYADGKQTIVFAVTVSHSKAIVKEFLKDGVKAEHIDGETPEGERDAILDRFKNRETTVLSNVSVFTEGFDAPGIEVVQCVRPTCSLSLWLQIIGRGLRIAEGKPHCILIDHSENWKHHGLPDDDREWSLEAISLKPGRWVLQCPECDHCFKALSHEQKPYRKVFTADGTLKDLYRSACPHCRTQFEWDQGKGSEGGVRIIEKATGEVQAVELTCNQWAVDFFKEVCQIQESTGKKKGWIYYRAIEHDRCKEFSLGDWRYLGNLLGYKAGWAAKAFAEVQQTESPKQANVAS